MSQITRNLLANFGGRFVGALLAVVFIPLYVKLLGVEAYGLLGVFATVQAAFAILDLGLNSTITRELARLSNQPARSQDARDLVRTLELCYWTIGIAIGFAIMSLAGVVPHWVRSSDIPTQTIRQSIYVLGVFAALQWPQSFYEGGLQGLQRQVTVNAISVFSGVLRSVGSLLVLLFVSRSLQAYLLWQAVASAAQTGLDAVMLWRSLPSAPTRPRFQRVLVQNLWRFAAGVSATSLVLLVLTQADKVVVSRVVPLKAFGYYMLASTGAAGLHYFIGPVFTAVFPRFSQLYETRSFGSLSDFYHRAAQIASVLIIPAAVVLALFAPEVMLLWTRDATIAANTHLLLTILVIGTAMNGLWHMPHALQLAAGWTSLGFYSNLVGVLTLVPLTIFLALRFGGAGAAWCWLLLNAGYLLITVPLMHRRLLSKEMFKWYVTDIGRPLTAALLVGVTCRLLVSGAQPLPATFFALVATSVVTLLSGVIATPTVRQSLNDRLSSMLLGYKKGEA